MNWHSYFWLVVLFSALRLNRVFSQFRQTNIIDYIRELNRQTNANGYQERLVEEVDLLNEYDFIVVGAGTAGCTLAARLSENPKWKVLLLEAGGSETLVMDIPATVHFLQANRDINWDYRTQPSHKYCLGLNNKRCIFPRGKVMGGSSVLNYMIYTRGNRHDYDKWSEMGNEGWSYEEVLPYFKKLEGSTVPDADADYVGRHGPVTISYAKHRSRIAKAFVQASQENGKPLCDYNGKNQMCVSYIQSTTKRGFRWSSNRAYLDPVKGKRTNLHIRKNALVTQILIDPLTKTAYGVLFESNDKSFKVNARLEVVSSAGAINTPQLLMLSGVGPAKHLREVGIKPIADLAVGFNLQDHFAPALSFYTNESSLRIESFLNVEEFLKLQTDSSVLSLPGGVEAIAFYSLDNATKNDDNDRPEIEIFLVSGGLENNPAVQTGYGIRNDIFHELFDNVVATDANTFTIFVMMLNPRSRGRIMLKSNNPKQHPLIYPNYLHDPHDLDVTVRGLQKAIEITQSPAMRQIDARVLNTTISQCRKFGDVTSSAYLECYTRYFTLTNYHQSGSAKMGPKSDRTAVVDARLRVHGMRNLRVVDGSIMPSLISGHPNGPTYMIAEKAADMIKKDYGYL